ALCHSYDGRLLEEVRVEFHAHAVAGGDRYGAVADFEIGRVPGFLFGGGAVELHPRADVRRGGGELQDVDAGGAGLRVVRADPQVGLTRHAGHAGGADEATVVVEIRLHHVHDF